MFTLSTNPHIFNVDDNNNLKLSSMFSGLELFEYDVTFNSNTTFDKYANNNTDTKLEYFSSSLLDFVIPKLELYDNTNTPMPFKMTTKPSETCLTFDYLPTNTTGNAECELNNNEIVYTTIKDDILRHNVKKNLQTTYQFDFMLTTDGIVYVSYRNGTYEDITKHVFDDDFHEESKNIHEIYMYNPMAGVRLVVFGDKNIYVIDVSFMMDRDYIMLLLKLEAKIKKNKIADINIDQIEQITGSYKNYYIFVRKGDKKGIHTLTMSGDRSDYTVNYISSVTVGSIELDLNIVNVYGLHKAINVAYLLIEGNGLVAYDLDNTKVLGMLDNQYITKIDQIDTGDYTYLGLFLDNKAVDEFFVELAISTNDPVDWKLSRAYLSKKEFIYSASDKFRSFTYFSTANTTYLISRNQLIEKMIPVYKFNLAVDDYIVYSDTTHYSVIKPKNGPKDEIIAFDFTLDYPYYTCRFNSVGNFTAALSSYKRILDIIYRQINYEISVSEDDMPTGSFGFLFYLLIGAAVIAVIVGVVWYIRKRYTGQVDNRNYNII
jgi:hypothetical protein